MYAAAAAKSLQSCPTLYDPIDGSPPGSSVHGILQARTLEWVAISSSNAWKWKVQVMSLSHVRLFATPWTAAYQAPPSMGLSRQEYWSGVPLPSPIYVLKKRIWKSGYVCMLYMCNQFTLLYTWNKCNIVNQLYSLKQTNKTKSLELSQITDTSEHQLIHGRFSKFVVGTYLLSNNSASLISFNSVTKLVRNMLLSLFYKWVNYRLRNFSRTHS